MKNTRFTLAVLAVIAMLASAACTPADNPSTPETTPAVTATIPLETPTPVTPEPSFEATNPTPTPLPTETLDEDQTAARDVVLEYYELLNAYGMDDSLKDYTPLTNITSGDAQILMITALDSYRMAEAVQTAPVEVSILDVQQAPGVADVVTVEACVDATRVDLVTKETGESILSPDRDPVNIFTWDVVQQDGYWLLNDVSASPISGCP